MTPRLLLSLLALIMLTAAAPRSRAADLHPVLKQLDEVMARRETFYRIKERRIDSLRILFSDATLPRDHRLRYCAELFSEYSSYQGDSAQAYAKRLHDLTEGTLSADERVMANTSLLSAYITGGLFLEAGDLVKETSLKGVSAPVRVAWFWQLVRFYSDMSAYAYGSHRDAEYARLVRVYSDSIIAIAPPGSYEAQYSSIYNRLNSMSPDQKITLFKTLLERPDINADERAKLTAIIADFYSEKGDMDSVIFFKATSVIHDIRAAKHETTASCDLALFMHRAGDSRRAQALIRLANQDANFYNARARKINVNNVLPLVEEGRVNDLRAQRDLYVRFMIIATLLLLMLVASFIIIMRKNRHLKMRRRDIEQQRNEISHANEVISSQNSRLSAANEQLAAINARAEETNQRLREAMKIKDEYIGYAFTLSAHYQTKIDSIYNLVDRRLALKQYDEIRRSLSRRDISKDKEVILREFDTIFLHLFPTFVSRFKELFPETDPVRKQPDDQLTTEMRIFAFIRLGITDVNHMAGMLNYTVSTINTYKSKTKNRSILPNDLFEPAIMDIQSA